MRRDSLTDSAVSSRTPGFVSPGARILATALVFAAASLGLPGVAAGAPPSGVEEYVLDIPGAGGSKHPGPGGGGVAASQAVASQAAARERRAQERRAETPAGETSAGAETVAAGAEGDSPLAALATALTFGAGTGALLPVVLWLTLAGAVVALARRRSGATRDAGRR